MQAFQNNGLRILRRPLLIPGSSQLPSCQRNASYFRPFEWVREKLSAGVKEAQTVEEVETAKEQAKKEGTASLFEDVAEIPAVEEKVSPARRRNDKPKARKQSPTSHKYSTANFKISHRKLNMLGRQIAGKPIDQAILQMQFSEKRASTRIMNMLATARDHAGRYKGLREGKLVVAEAWVSKGPHFPKRLEPRGRGHYGTRTHPNSKISIILKEGKTLQEEKEAARKRKLNRIVSAAIVREDKPIRNPSATWGW